MIALLVVLLSLLSPLNVQAGLASQYAEGVMENTVALRRADKTEIVLEEEPPLPVDGYIAVRDCHHIGELWLVRLAGSERWELFQVADCAVRNDTDGTRSWMDERGVVVEVDYPTAVRWGVVGRLVPVEVWYNNN